MNSISREITKYTLANEIRLQRAVHRGSFLILEGGSDCRLMRRFVDEEECEIINSIGRDNVIDAIDILTDVKFSGAVGVVDRDYFLYLGGVEESKNLFFTDENDVEIMIAASAAMNNFLGEFGSKAKIDAKERATGIPIGEVLFTAAAPIGALRLISLENGWNLKFHDMKYKFVSNMAIEIDIGKMVNHIIGRSDFDARMSYDEVVTKIAKKLELGDEKKMLCNGHDFVRILGRALKSEIGNDNSFDGDASCELLEKTLRLSYDYQEFKKSRLFSKLSEWEEITKYTVFKTV